VLLYVGTFGIIGATIVVRLWGRMVVRWWLPKIDNTAPHLSGETTMRTVTIGALIKRINRRLKRERRELKISRGQTARSKLGNHYVLDMDQYLVIGTHVDLEKMGRELRVLDPDEKVE
jgi:hypothetical protein